MLTGSNQGKITPEVWGGRGSRRCRWINFENKINLCFLFTLPFKQVSSSNKEQPLTEPKSPKRLKEPKPKNNDSHHLRPGGLVGRCDVRIRGRVRVNLPVSSARWGTQIRQTAGQGSPTYLFYFIWHYFEWLKPRSDLSNSLRKTMLQFR